MERQQQKPFSFEGETAGALANLLAESKKLQAGVRSRSPLTESNKPEAAVLSEAGCMASRLTLLDPTRTGADARYGARHIKRTIERFLVQLPSNLMATSQIHTDDRICITHRSDSPSLTCFREADSLEEWDAMV